MLTYEPSLHLTQSKFTEIFLDVTQYKVFENHMFEHTATSAKGQWVKYMRKNFKVLYQPT